MTTCRTRTQIPVIMVWCLSQLSDGTQRRFLLFEVKMWPHYSAYQLLYLGRLAGTTNLFHFFTTDCSLLEYGSEWAGIPLQRKCAGNVLELQTYSICPVRLPMVTPRLPIQPFPDTSNESAHNVLTFTSSHITLPFLLIIGSMSSLTLQKWFGMKKRKKRC